MPSRPGAPLPTLLLAVTVVAMLQGAALVIGSIGYAGWLLATRPRHLGLALSAATVLLIFGVALVALGRGLRARRRAAVSPTVLLELLCLPVAYSMVGAGQWLVAVVVAVPAAAVLAGLFSPSGREIVRGDQP